MEVAGLSSHRMIYRARSHKRGVRVAGMEAAAATTRRRTRRSRRHTPILFPKTLITAGDCRRRKKRESAAVAEKQSRSLLAPGKIADKGITQGGIRDRTLSSPLGSPCPPIIHFHKGIRRCRSESIPSVSWGIPLPEPLPFSPEF